MNILHISSANSWRGGEQQISYLIDELYHLGNSNFLMHPFNAPIAKHSSILGKCTLLPYRKISSANPLVALKIKKLVRKHDIDIIHAHDSHAHNYLYLSYILFKNKYPSVVSRRVDFPISNSSLNKYKYSHIKKIICVSNKIKDVVTKSIGYSDRIVTVHSGVDPYKFQNTTTINLKTTYNIPLKDKIIANVSAIADHKDYETFVDTAYELLKIRPDVSFLIIGGDSGEKNKIVNKISSMHLEKKIIITGYLENAYKLISQFDIFLFPSKMEGLGTSLLDAQCSEIPIVSTYAGGIPELITHKKSGLLSKIGDSKDLAHNINLLLQDKRLAKRIINGAKENATKFSKMNTARKTLEIYQSVIKN